MSEIYVISRIRPEGHGREYYSGTESGWTEKKRAKQFTSFAKAETFCGNLNRRLSHGHPAMVSEVKPSK